MWNVAEYMEECKEVNGPIGQIRFSKDGWSKGGLTLCRTTTKWLPNAYSVAMLCRLGKHQQTDL